MRISASIGLMVVHTFEQAGVRFSYHGLVRMRDGSEYLLPLVASGIRVVANRA